MRICDFETYVQNYVFQCSFIKIYISQESLTSKIYLDPKEGEYPLSPYAHVFAQFRLRIDRYKRFDRNYAFSNTELDLDPTSFSRIPPGSTRIKNNIQNHLQFI